MLRKRKRKTSADGATTRRVTRQRRVLDDVDSTVSDIASGSPRTPRATRKPVTGRRSTRKKTIASGNHYVTMSTRSRKTVLPKSPRDSDAENVVDPPKQKSKRAASTRSATETDIHSTRSRAKKEVQKREIRKKRIMESKTIVGDNNSSMQLKLDRISIVTPKSSPLIVDLTPHRSSKTPKKSPVNIGSPKTHSKSPLRLSKTPRKLTVSVESPATSDNSSVSVPDQSPVGSETNRHDSHVMLVDFMKQASPKPSSPYKSSSLLTADEIWQQVVASSPIATVQKKSTVSTLNYEGPKRLRSSNKLLPRVFRRSEEENDRSLELLDCDEFVDLSGNCVNLDLNGTFDMVAENQEKKLDIKCSSPRKRYSENFESTPDTKRRCRVRFASPNGKTLPQRSIPAFGTSGRDRIGARSIIGSIDPGRSKRRSRSLTKTPASRAGAKRRSNSASAFPDRTPRLSQSIQSSVNRLSRPRKTVNSEAKSEVKVKVSVPGKIPNFAHIHQKKFEKMESLVEAKKRVARRHEELKIAVPTRSSPRSSSAPLAKKLVPVPSSKTMNNEFNRFGFKLRKVEAVDMMTKKAPVAAKTKNHVVSNRSVLKDVRTNKRFELQMKFRKLNDDKR